MRLINRKFCGLLSAKHYFKLFSQDSPQTQTRNIRPHSQQAGRQHRPMDEHRSTPGIPLGPTGQINNLRLGMPKPHPRPQRRQKAPLPQKRNRPVARPRTPEDPRGDQARSISITSNDDFATWYRMNAEEHGSPLLGIEPKHKTTETNKSTVMITLNTLNPPQFSFFTHSTQGYP